MVLEHSDAILDRIAIYYFQTSWIHNIAGSLLQTIRGKDFRIRSLLAGLLRNTAASDVAILQSFSVPCVSHLDALAYTDNIA